MTIHERRANALFHQGYNCAQAVFAAFADDLGMDEKGALRLAAPFGGGYGRLREVCGAASAMMMVLGALEGCDTPDDDGAKQACYARAQALMGAFEAEFGSYICRVLLDTPGPEDPAPRKRDADYYAERPCARFVNFAARLLDERVL